MFDGDGSRDGSDDGGGAKVSGRLLTIDNTTAL